MHETLCFSIQSPSPNLDDLYLCGATVARRSRVWSDHVRIMVGSVPHCKWGFHLFFVHARSTEFHCDLQL